MYWRKCAVFLVSQRTQGVNLISAPLDVKKICGISEWEIGCSFLQRIHWNFDATWQFFHHSLPDHLGQWVLARKVLKYVEGTQDFFFRGSKSTQVPQSWSPMLKGAGNSEVLTFTSADFALCEKREKPYKSLQFFGVRLIYSKSGQQHQVSRTRREGDF